MITSSFGQPYRWQHWPLVLVLALSLVRGLLYASLMPPWDLVDEEQHFHYIQYLAEEHRLPVLGETYLSPSVVDAIFQVNRWQAQGLPSPSSNDPRQMGLEGHSYEAYQPPLFYLLLAPLYGLAPGDLLTVLYILRFAVVSLGTVSVLLTYLLARALVGDRPLVAYGAAAFLALIPERTMAVSRVNNDALSEVMSLLMLLLLVRGLRQTDVRLSLAAGIVLGGGLLTKLSALALVPLVLLALAMGWWGRKLSLREACYRGGLVLGLGAVASGGWFWRNLTLYGDATGTRAFLSLASFRANAEPVDFLKDLFGGFWVMWWSGPLVDYLRVLLALVAVAALVGLARLARRQEPALLLLAAVVVNVAGAWWATYIGLVPVVQGRLVLPAAGAIAILLVWGLAELFPSRWARMPLAFALATLLLLDTMYLFGHLVPTYYFWRTIT